MNVKELIELLQEYPPDSEVILNNGEGYFPVKYLDGSIQIYKDLYGPDDITEDYKAEMYPTIKEMVKHKKATTVNAVEICW